MEENLEREIAKACAMVHEVNRLEPGTVEANQELRQENEELRLRARRRKPRPRK